jgi:hypothetical protein
MNKKTISNADHVKKIKITLSVSITPTTLDGTFPCNMAPSLLEHHGVARTTQNVYSFKKKKTKR